VHESAALGADAVVGDAPAVTEIVGVDWNAAVGVRRRPKDGANDLFGGITPYNLLRLEIDDGSDATAWPRHHLLLDSAVELDNVHAITLGGFMPIKISPNLLRIPPLCHQRRTPSC